MDQLLKFLYAYRVIIVFFLLEIFCAYLLVSNNEYLRDSYFNTANGLIAPMLRQKSQLQNYFHLSEINQNLARENTALRNELEGYRARLNRTSFHIPFYLDSGNRYIAAEVIANTVNLSHNYIAINKGYAQGARIGMGIVNGVGAVGKIKYVSKNHSVAVSMLNVDFQVSSMILRMGYVGSLKWMGDNPKTMKLLYIPRHVLPLKGDTVVTSRYNTVFPQGIPIGIVQQVTLPSESIFFDIDVTLFQDFSSLNHVIIVDNRNKQEIDSLLRGVEKMEP